MNPTKIAGYGADADPSKRPGVPAERKPSPWPHAKLEDGQKSSPSVLSALKRGKLPPVFGSAQPPKGLAGWVRRRAYESPPHLPRRWMMLLLADRIDVLEHRMGGTAGLVAAAVGAGLLIGLRRKRKRFWH